MLFTRQRLYVQSTLAFVCLFVCFLTKTSKYIDRQPRPWNHQQHDVTMTLNCVIVLIKLCQGIGNH